MGIERRTINVAAIQLKIDRDLDSQLDRVAGLVSQAIGNGASLICLPELFHKPYFCQTEDEKWFAEAEPIPGPVTDRVARWIGDKDVTIIAPLFEKRAPGIYHNSAAIIHGMNGLLGVYRKMHIPDDPGFYEKYYFSPGDADPGFRSWDAGDLKFGVAICWDQWFPETARITALSGAEILFFPTAIGWHPAEKETRGPAQLEGWELVQRSHAVTNGMYVVSVNRVGFEKPNDGESEGIEFWGKSFIVAPDGQFVCQSRRDGDEILQAEIDLGRVEQHRIEWPFLRDRRLDAYGGISHRVIDGSSQESL